MKYNVLDRERKVFKFSDIFIICGGFYNKKPQGNQSGKIPFLGATDSNNGVTQFNSFKDIDSNSKTGNGENEPIEKKIFKGNCIAVTNNGSVGHAYYWKNSFTCSHDINPLYLRNYELTPFIAKFLITCIEQQAVSFMYSRKRRPKRMKKSSILLPVDDLGNPDYKFMEDFIKEREKIKREKYRQYVENKLKTLVENQDFRERELLNKKWGEFKVKDIFNINTGGDLIINKVKQGNIPVISHTALNNGVALYSDEISGRKKFSCKNTISLADRGNFKAFVQNQDFYVGTRVKALESKRKEIKQPALFFLSRVIDNQSIKFSYGHNACDNLGDLKIMLPITENEEIDYEFMENYMKYLMLRKYQKYLDFIG